MPVNFQEIYTKIKEIGQGALPEDIPTKVMPHSELEDGKIMAVNYEIGDRIGDQRLHHGIGRHSVITGQCIVARSADDAHGAAGIGIDGDDVAPLVKADDEIAHVLILAGSGHDRNDAAVRANGRQRIGAEDEWR